MEEKTQKSKPPKALIICFALVCLGAIVAVILTVIITGSKGKDSDEIASRNTNGRGENVRNEASYKWVPTSIGYVPEDKGDEIAKSIDRVFGNVTDPAYTIDFDLNDKQVYAVIIACMYSYDNLDTASQAKVQCFYDLSKKYEELYLALNSGTADTSSQTNSYNAGDNVYFSKSVSVKKELYKAGTYIVDSYDVNLRRNIWGDPYLDADPNYTKTNDVYLYTFDVTYMPNNLGSGEITNGSVHVYFNNEYAGDVTFNNSNTASGQFAIRSTKNYTADDFDSLFYSNYADVKYTYNYSSDAQPYNHQLFPGMTLVNSKYYEDIGNVDPGENVSARDCFWPAIYRPGAKPD